MTTRSAAANAASVEEVKKLLKGLNLPQEQVKLLVDYVPKDPEQRMPLATLSKEEKIFAFQLLAQLMTDLQENTLLSLVDEWRPDFIDNVSRCIAEFPLNKSLVELQKEISASMIYPSKHEVVLREIYLENLRKYEQTKSMNLRKYEQMRSIIASYDWSCNIYKEAVDKSLRDYKGYQEARKAYDRKFILT